ncbi:MAG: hypothetical protein AUH78_16465 [Gemmatimonadetes bacterium 13_1_40CM_4_69_8]|nr:MAG: hypothetical protein AUH45_06380 [Gemmatimonadetes bacterium 13_1_40CM_69_22]OLC72218.1 MAG: hypothetical protein AUH78_16465 [Gemmatimonadetes bacterium 13_1_40CM_4_69_8]
MLALTGVGAGWKPARAQRLTVTEAGAGVTAVAARRGFYGAELGVARRPGGVGRFALTAAGGSYEGASGLRIAASAQFLLNPGDRTGTSLYGGVGIAFAAATSERGAGYLTALVGLESAPGRAAGWYAELGLAGGVRVSAGRRWRRLPSWWVR